MKRRRGRFEQGKGRKSKGEARGTREMVAWGGAAEGAYAGTFGAEACR